MTNSSRRRELLLEEMGLGPIWVSRERMPAPAEAEDSSRADVVATPMVVPEDPPFIDEPVPVSALAELAPPQAPAGAVAGMDWAQLKSTVSQCMKCDLCRGRTNTVFGVGDEKAKWLFVGEGPGRNEDARGEPFVGAAGKLLDNMLLAMGLRRGQNAYIANIVKCRPTDPGGRDRPPTPEEVAACMPYLERQIALIQPAIIIALGKTAGCSLLQVDPDTPVSRLRGTVHRHAGLPLVVTYHPAYLLRNLADKKKAWADLCLAKATYAGS